MLNDCEQVCESVITVFAQILLEYVAGAVTIVCVVHEVCALAEALVSALVDAVNIGSVGKI